MHKNISSFKIEGNPLEDPPLYIAKKGIKVLTDLFFSQYIDSLLSATAESPPADDSKDVPTVVARVVPEPTPEPVSGKQSLSQEERKLVLEIDPDDLDDLDGITVRFVRSQI